MSSFTEALRQLTSGQVDQALSDKFDDLVRAVQETRKIGEISIRLKVKPNGETSVTIAEEVKAKIPEKARGETIFFVNGVGQLTRNDPRQEVLPLRQITGSFQEQPLRTVAPIGITEPMEVARG